MEKQKGFPFLSLMYLVTIDNIKKKLKAMPCTHNSAFSALLSLPKVWNTLRSSCTRKVPDIFVRF